jgi:hypothetical protein
MEVHDSKIISYQRDYLKMELHIKIEDIKNKERTIIFNGVIASILNNDVDGCILFDIEKIEIDSFIKELGIERIKKEINTGFPLVMEMENNPVKVIIKKGVYIYKLESTYGLCGYILAESISWKI